MILNDLLLVVDIVLIIISDVMRSNLTTVGDNTSNQNIKINLMMKIFEYLVNKQYVA